MPELWRPGDRCQVVVLQDGRIYDGSIRELRGLDAIVRLDNGRLYRIGLDSSFLRRP